MASVSTEDFPYTLGYLTEFLQIDEAELMAFAQALSLSPKHDGQTGSVIFSHRDLEILRKAIEMKRNGEALATIVERLARKSASAAPSARESGYAQNPATEHPQSYVQPSRSIPSARSSDISLPGDGTVVKSSGKENLSVIIEAVSQAKEGILKDLSRLLDDKLAGLDEVVVELIRCKSENDALKQKLKASIQEKEAQEYELSRFKPVQFGFYRKV